MRISYDPAKRQKTLDDRGLDFEDVAAVFAGLTFEVEDTRQDYGETRMICFGYLAGRLAVIGYTPRGAARQTFSMRKATDRAQARISPHLKDRPQALGPIRRASRRERVRQTGAITVVPGTLQQKQARECYNNTKKH